MKPTNYRAPSVKSIMAAFQCDKATAETARALIRGEQRTKDVDKFPKANAWFSSCYHEPRRRERILACLNELLGGFGVEPIWGNDPYWPEAEYINTGDTYSLTILFNGTSFMVTAWGDWFERNEKRLSLR
jgi:hypothetical protein